jgi:hypothetical protein
MPQRFWRPPRATSGNNIAQAGAQFSIATGGWETPHELGLARSFSRRLQAVRGRGPAATLQARKCRRPVSTVGSTAAWCGFKSDRLLPVPTAAAPPIGVTDRSGEAMRPPHICELPLTSGYRNFAEHPCRPFGGRLSALHWQRSRPTDDGAGQVLDGADISA